LRPARGAAAEAIGEALDWVLDLVDLDVDAQVFQGEDRYEVELRGPDREQLIRDEGKLLAAIEHLVPRVLHGVCGETYAIRVDSENFQEGREDRLRETAQKVAEEVRRRGRAEVLEPMDPAARRVIHLALAEEPDVSTKSLGTGLYKRVKVFPS
jgi:spoIIIJ-associated protein